MFLLFFTFIQFSAIELDQSFLAQNLSLVDYNEWKKKMGSPCSLVSYSHFSTDRAQYVKFIWNNSYLYRGCRWKWNVIITVNFPILSNWKEEAWKKIRTSTGFEPVTSAIPVRCSTNWAMKPHIGSLVNLLSSYLPMQWNDVKFIWNNSYLYCGCRWKWNVIIAVNFPI